MQESVERTCEGTVGPEMLQGVESSVRIQHVGVWAEKGVEVGALGREVEGYPLEEEILRGADVVSRGWVESTSGFPAVWVFELDGTGGVAEGCCEEDCCKAPITARLIPMVLFSGRRLCANTVRRRCSSIQAKST